MSAAQTQTLVNHSQSLSLIFLLTTVLKDAVSMVARLISTSSVLYVLVALIAPCADRGMAIKLLGSQLKLSPSKKRMVCLLAKSRTLFRSYSGVAAPIRLRRF